MRLEFTEDDLTIEICPDCQGAKLTIRTTRVGDAIVTDEVPCGTCGPRRRPTGSVSLISDLM